LKAVLKQIQKKIKTLEYDLLVLVKQELQDVLTSLKTIPGIGNKTAVMLVVLTDGFDLFTSGCLQHIQFINPKASMNIVKN
jgi:3-methyladenine DNA glycosylase/8-oxoguanine DNA glycosylase